MRYRAENTLAHPYYYSLSVGYHSIHSPILGSGQCNLQKNMVILFFVLLLSFSLHFILVTNWSNGGLRGITYNFTMRV